MDARRSHGRGADEVGREAWRGDRCSPPGRLLGPSSPWLFEVVARLIMESRMVQEGPRRGGAS